MDALVDRLALVFLVNVMKDSKLKEPKSVAIKVQDEENCFGLVTFCSRANL